MTLNNDVFTLSATNEVNITHSITRVGGELAGVLILHNNKTYGRQQKTNKKSIAKPKGPSTYLVIPITKKLKIKTVLSGIVG